MSTRKKGFGLTVFTIAAAVVAAAVLILSNVLSDSDKKPSQTRTETDRSAIVSVTETEIAKEYYFRSEKQLNEHFKKHGGEFDYADAEEYRRGACEVINNLDSLHKTEKEDGDDIYYLEKTNEIVFVSADGYIRTYFRPDSGISYYNKQ